MAEFDEAMKSRLLAFQKAHGLAEDGLAGAKTWTKLVESADATPAKAAETAETVETAKVAEVRAELPVTPENFPTLFAVAEKCQDEAGMKNFLRDEIGVDIDAVLEAMDRVLGAEAQEVSAQ